MKKQTILNESIGWIGMILIVLAYTLVNFSILKPENIIYILFNLIGAIGIVYISMIKKAYQPAALNVIWALVAIVAIVRLLI